MTVSGAAATGEKFDAVETTATALAEPSTWTCVTANSAANGTYECYGTDLIYLEDNEAMLTAKLRLTDTLPYTQKNSANLAVERRLAGTTNAADTDCVRTIKIENGVGTETTSQPTGDECDGFSVRVEDQLTSDSAWTAVLVYTETVADDAAADTTMTTLGTSMATVDVYASVKKSPATDAFTNDATVELKA